MKRRTLLASFGAVAAASAAGCADIDDEENHRVEITDVLFEQIGSEFVGIVELTNEGEEEERVDLESRLEIGTDGVYGGYTNEIRATVPSEGSTNIELTLVDRDEISEVANHELSDGYTTVTFSTNGEEAFREEPGAQPSQHISFRVMYPGSWQGAIGSEGSLESVERQGDAHLPVSNSAQIISGNAQKTDDSQRRLLVQIIVDGDVIAEGETTANYGVAQISGFATDSPISNPREPYTPPEERVRGQRQTEPESEQEEVEESEIPDGETAKQVVLDYFDAINQGDTDAANALIHPDSPGDRWTDEDMAAWEGFEISPGAPEIVAVDERRGTATVRIEITVHENGEEVDRFDASPELRVSDGQWKLWLSE